MLKKLAVILLALLLALSLSPTANAQHGKRHAYAANHGKDHGYVDHGYKITCEGCLHKHFKIGVGDFECDGKTAYVLYNITGLRRALRLSDLDGCYGYSWQINYRKDKVTITRFKTCEKRKGADSCTRWRTVRHHALA